MKIALERSKGMNDARQFEKLRAEYCRRWDAHQIIADQNARLAQAGTQPSNEKLINEQRAAEAVKLARDELIAARNRIGNGTASPTSL
jgi:hypothetical protein